MQYSATGHEATSGQGSNNSEGNELLAEGPPEAQQQLHEAVQEALLKQAIINSNQRYLCRLLRSSRFLTSAVHKYCAGQLVARVKPTATSSFPAWLARHSHVVGQITITDEYDGTEAADEARLTFNARLMAALQDASSSGSAQQQAGSSSASCCLSQLRCLECRTLPAGLLHHLSAGQLTRLAFQDTQVPEGASIGRFTALKELKAAAFAQPIAASSPPPLALEDEADREQLMASLTSLQQLTSLDLHVNPDDLWQLPANLQGQLQHLRTTFWGFGRLHLGPFTGLTALDMDSEGQVDAGDVLPPNLQRLDGVQYLNTVQPLLPLQQLRAISGVACYVGNFIEACHRLPSLTSIRGCFASDPDVLRLPAGMVLEVDVVEAVGLSHNSADSLDTWQRLGRLTAVTCLDVTGSVLTWHFAAALQNLKRLQKLVLTRPWCWRMDSREGRQPTYPAFSPMAALDGRPSSSIAVVMSRNLIEAVAELPELRQLHLDDVWLNDVKVLGQLQKLSKLTALKLSCCNLPTRADSMKALLRRLPLLQHLDLSLNPAVDDDLAASLHQMLPRLVDLDLHGSTVSAVDGTLHDQLTRVRL